MLKLKGYIAGKWYLDKFKKIKFFYGDEREIIISGSIYDPTEFVKTKNFLRYLDEELNNLKDSLDGYAVNVIYASERIPKEEFYKFTIDSFNKDNELSLKIASEFTEELPKYMTEANRFMLSKKFKKELEDCIKLMTLNKKQLKKALS